MSKERNKAIVERFVEETFVKFNGEAMDELVAEDFRSHAWKEDFGVPDGPDGARQFIAVLASAFSNADVIVEDVVAEGDRVVARYVYEADHTGELMGVGATDERIRLPGIFIVRMENGRIAEYWRQEDILGLMRQIGAIPSPEQAGV